ncbi:MAG: alkaline phosphatase family protein [Clostridiales bacterium]|nr:alkaline phosphatase family protein [Clostridiales bacterium]
MSYPLPDYENCLVNLSNSILKNFGVEPIEPTLKIADKILDDNKHRNVVVILLDAMGISILEKHLKPDGFLCSHLVCSYDSVFPPTTVAATTSVMSGLYPNEHGWLGWDMYYPKLDKNVSVFINIEQRSEKDGAVPDVDENGQQKWTPDSLNETCPAADYNAGFTFTPYKNIIDRINEAGGEAYFSMPFMPPFPHDLEAILSRVTDLCKKPGKKYIYAYWNEPDTTMHRTGTISSDTHAMVVSLESRIRQLAEELEDTLLIVTADHGHMDSRNICILDHPEVLKCLVRMPSIEPRTLNLFVKEEYKKDFPKIFRENIGEDFLILTREEVIADKIFGIGTDRDGLDQMIGDYVAISIGSTSVFTTHIEAQEMPGGHAGLTKEELEIPLIAIEID